MSQPMPTQGWTVRASRVAAAKRQGEPDDGDQRESDQDAEPHQGVRQRARQQRQRGAEARLLDGQRVAVAHGRVGMAVRGGRCPMARVPPGENGVRVAGLHLRADHAAAGALADCPARRYDQDVG